jgi:proteasome lid subunit RPN8/RPN11
MLIINQEILDDIYEYAKLNYPEECCGILVGYDSGSDRHVTAAHRATNVSDEHRHDRYLIDEKKLIEVIRSNRGKSTDVIGFYHSHPDYPSRPSQYDTEHAAWPGYSYLIVSVEKSRVVSAQSWVMPEEGGAFIEQPITIKQDEKA